ncbi:MAG: glycine oxidase ThiO [Actinomycetota bacterium]|nr:glycine oxidase ThiO [Actinomycetota bacterium]
MASTGAAPDVVVVGGGIVGLTIAWSSRQAGATVALVDPSPGRGATWAAAGMLAPVTEVHFGEEPLVALLLAAAEAWPSFASGLEAATGHPVGLRTEGTLVVAADRSDRIAIDQVTLFQRSLGLPVTALTGRECRALEPALASSIVGGADVPGDHQVDNRLVAEALVAACTAGGVTMVAERASGLVVGPGGQATGVALADGSTLPAGTVVVSLGTEWDRFSGIPPAAVPPVRPVLGVTLRLRARGTALVPARTVRGLVHGSVSYLVPRADGTVVVGATAEERGEPLEVTAGAVHGLLRDARTLVPSVDEYALVDATAGLRPGTPDNGPVVGATDMAGLVVAGGTYRNGILLSPLIGRAVAGLVTGTAIAGPLAAFGPGRFAAGLGGRQVAGATS